MRSIDGEFAREGKPRITGATALWKRKFEEKVQRYKLPAGIPNLPS
jgi:hypothetical protein